MRTILFQDMLLFNTILTLHIHIHTHTYIPKPQADLKNEKKTTKQPNP